MTAKTAQCYIALAGVHGYSVNCTEPFEEVMSRLEAARETSADNPMGMPLVRLHALAPFETDGDLLEHDIAINPMHVLYVAAAPA